MRTQMFLVILAVVLTGTLARADQHGVWHWDVVKGHDTYWTINKTGSRFTIWCPPKHAFQRPVIGINIDGHGPNPNSVVKLELNRKVVRFSSDKDGYIRVNCPACIDNMSYLWNMLRSATSFRVLLDDDRFAGFSLVGARHAFPSKVCEEHH